MESAEGRRGRVLLGAWLAAIFAVSGVSDPRLLAFIAAAAAVLFHRGLLRTARRVLRSVVPLTGGLSLASWAWLRLVAPRPPEWEPFLALALRAVLVAFVTFAMLDRVDLFRALAPWPLATRLLVLTLAQIHALRLLATESLQGLRSRMPRRLRARDVIRGAGGITGIVLTLSARNARDISDAMRSRGF